MREFEVSQELDLAAAPEQVWDALTLRTAGWLFPNEYEPRVGGAATGGSVVRAWDPPHHLVVRTDGPDGWFNELDQTVTATDTGSRLRWVHSGVFVEEWSSQYDGVAEHTDFYLHTLAEYLAHFAGRTAVWSSANGPAESVTPDGLTRLRAALGLADDAAVGDRMRVTLPDGPTEAVVDYVHPHFVGLRTGEQLVRVFGRNAFGAPVGVAVHDFAADAAPAEQTEAAWERWLAGVYA
jgi:uncharacterized protein YndB with AHSA1/START domain